MLSKKDKQGLWIIAGIAIVAIILVIFKIKLDSAPKPGKDNCYENIESNTVILLDYTDPIPQQTKDEITARTNRFVRENVKTGDKVTIFKISEISKQSLKPVLSICKPSESGNRAIENIGAIKRNFETGFLVPIQDILSSDPESSVVSPLAQAITDISLSQYLRANANNLLIFSDMIEHSEKFSLYKCNDPTSVITKYKSSRVGAQERPIFTNTKVELNLIPRLDLSTTTLSCRDKLWLWFFGDNEGSNASLTSEYLPGGATINDKKALSDAR